MTERYAMPTKAVPMTFHFKKVLKSKKPVEFELMQAAAAKFPHIQVEVTEIRKDGETEVSDVAIKRVSETHTLLVPDFAALLMAVSSDDEGNLNVDGVTAKEFTKVQEDVERSVFDFAKGMLDGTYATNDDGDPIRVDGEMVLEGFKVPTPENCSYSILAAIEKAVRAAGGRADSIPAELRDEAVASLLEWLTTSGVPEQGRVLYGKLAKSYYSRNVAASLQAEAIERTSQRCQAWYDQLDEDDKIKFVAFHTRLQARAQDILKPQDVDLGIL